MLPHKDHYLLTTIQSYRHIPPESVSDESGIRDGLLKQIGWYVELAGDEREAVSLASLKRYDLILMVMLMPIMGGTEARTEIRQMPGQDN